MARGAGQLGPSRTARFHMQHPSRSITFYKLTRKALATFHLSKTFFSVAFIFNTKLRILYSYCEPSIAPAKKKKNQKKSARQCMEHETCRPQCIAQCCCGPWSNYIQSTDQFLATIPSGEMINMFCWLLWVTQKTGAAEVIKSLMARLWRPNRQRRLYRPSSSDRENFW